jgi:hypothetical protein
VTQTFQDPPEKIEFAKRHRERIQRRVKNSSWGCPWCGVMVAPVRVGDDSLAFDSDRLDEGNVSVGVRGLFLHPGSTLPAHTRSCEGYRLHRKDLKRFRRPTGFGFGADRDLGPWEWGH